MNVKSLKILLFVMMAFILAACAKDKPKVPEVKVEKLPVSEKIVQGRLENGLKYYILKNNFPKDIIELRLNVRSGSLNETEEERGLAHFVEHMAFNGTKNFPGNGVIDFMEELGLTFGKHSNAYTSTGVTNYQLSVPLEKKELLDKSFLILRDWADGLVFDEEEIEKEKGVIVEEWRMRNDYRSRMRNQARAHLLAGSAFPDRDPIGLMEVVRGANKKLLKGYYDKWYTAENMAVIVVGNIDEKEIEEIIKKNFASMEKRSTPTPTSEEVPVEKDRLRFEKIVDKEAPSFYLSFDRLTKTKPLQTYADYKEHILDYGTFSMVNKRLSRKKLAKELDLISMRGSASSLAKTTKTYRFLVTLKEDDYLNNLEEFFTEIERFKRHGFTLEEYKEMVKVYRRLLENYAREGESIESKQLVNGIVQHDLYNGDLLDPAQELAVFNKTISELNVVSFNKRIKKMLEVNDKLFMLAMPESIEKDIKLTKEQVVDIMTRVEASDVAKDAEGSGKKALIEKAPEPAKVVKREKLDNIQSELITFENGSELIIRKSDINKHKYMILGIRGGGTSTIKSERDYIIAANLRSVIGVSGFEGISKNDVSRILAGHRVKVAPGAQSFYEYFSGGGDTDDMELALQLMNLYLTSFEITDKGFEIAKESFEKGIESAERNRFSMFIRTVLPELYNNKYRRGYLLKDDLKSLTKDDFMRIYNEIYGDVDGYTFSVVGDVDVEKTIDLFARYIGTIKPKGTVKAKTQLVDRGTKFAKRRGAKTGYGEIEPKTTVIMRYESNLRNTDENFIAASLVSSILKKKLREEVREKRGGVYGISGSVSLDMVKDNYASGIIKFTCDPERADELIQASRETIDKIIKGGIKAGDLNTAREQAKLRLDELIKKNNFWLTLYPVAKLYGRDMRDYDKRIADLDAVTLEQVNKLYRDFMKNSKQFVVRFEPEQKK